MKHLNYNTVQKPLESLYNILRFGLSSRQINAENIFTVQNPDYNISPKTGMSRQHWLDAAQYLLSGAFMYIQNQDTPMYFPKQIGKTQPARIWHAYPTMYLEGLCRTLFLAVPLLREENSVSLNGIALKDYYRRQLELLVEPNSKTYLRHRVNDEGPSQPLVEFGSLAISLTLLPEILWQPLSSETKNALAALMLSYADGPTVPNNWRFFNIFILSFLKKNGYQISDDYLQHLLEESLNSYVADGWYQDNPSFDYYSMWGFQTYSQIWNHFYGDLNPHVAKGYQQNFSELPALYPHLFDREGRMIMWGRSITYRTAAIAPLPFMANSPGVNSGNLRKIASSVLLQFLQHPDLLKGGIPTLGFYGAFEPSVQAYNCRASVYWMGKAFLGLMLPEQHPFWNAVENDGDWVSDEQNRVIPYYSSKTGILITNDYSTGFSELRAIVDHAKNSSNNVYLKNENYNRLAYHSNFPWQADDPNDGTVAMNYMLKNRKGEWEALCQFENPHFEESIYTLKAHLESEPEIQLQLSETILPSALRRKDRIHTNRTVDIRWGSYALPQKDQKIKVEKFTISGKKAISIDNGEYKITVQCLNGWDQAVVLEKNGLHPEAQVSAVINLCANLSAGDHTLACEMKIEKNK